MTAAVGICMNESAVETRHRKSVELKGGRSYKFVCPSVNGMPDRLDLLPIPTEAHRKIVAQYIQFTETKAPGKKPRADQDRRHRDLRALGFEVNVVDG